MGGLPVPALWEFLQLAEVLHEVHLQPDQEDKHVWRMEASGQFSSKSAYHAFFIGSIEFEPWKRLWRTWAPLKVKLFVWLALWNRCWTADRLAKRGLPHSARCVLCDQEMEDMHHRLVGCVFVREAWFQILQAVGMAQLMPT